MLENVNCLVLDTGSSLSPKGKEFLLGCCSFALPLTQVMQGEQCRRVSEAPSLLLLSYPWNAFHLVDNKVLRWNRVCTTLPFKFILKYLFVLCGVYCLKALRRAVPLGCIKETKYTVRNEDVLGGAGNNRITMWDGHASMFWKICYRH